MHGVLKVKTSEEKARELKAKEKIKIDEYRSLVNAYTEHRKLNEFNDNSLLVTKKVLEINPEYYTVWNFRRDTINHFATVKDNETMQTLYTSEMKFIEECIQRYTKSYWVWYHRKWISQRIDKCDWDRELKLCSKLLDLDLRNCKLYILNSKESQRQSIAKVHCWGYRRFVGERSNIALKKEFDYTTVKIEQNFSNYSAWHQRSALLPKMYTEPTELFDCLVQEFELVRNAAFTEPKDQSTWIYHKWLVGTIKTIPNCNYKEVLEGEIVAINELLEIEPDCKWPIYTLLTLKMELGNSTKEELQSLLNNLKSIDSDHIKYYESLETQI
ncbi:protein geranylgeranyltransferase type II [Heterostelium album PN500]|uniref:Geranylgeranyl transferase type-2 subunit alpha n=1 Tax=Heterostelium pallidum (strain ATCC 26659 / Pp 5 / PN500) TaxID=670386 RepID=D3B081_HETP5|nr:protein geranylgeranyltransferase type II [Heterostelium album PN500]EFA84705.1 protein geranylgeranyltransferase type II [Heterostelium album PN500]|eukprot:XP_020436818.1 protein geranylgeranyltransferase type II [Heterostelium album PN500]